MKQSKVSSCIFQQFRGNMLCMKMLQDYFCICHHKATAAISFSFSCDKVYTFCLFRNRIQRNREIRLCFLLIVGIVLLQGIRNRDHLQNQYDTHSGWEGFYCKCKAFHFNLVSTRED